MTRIRTVKPEFWSSPDTAACEDPWARLLFIAMWNWADDAGIGTANARELGGFAFPNDEWITNDDIRRMLGCIKRSFGVLFYQVGRRTYYAIPSWDDHQKIDRRSEGKHPKPEQGTDWDPDPDAETLDEPSTSPRRALGGNRPVTARGSSEMAGTSPRRAANGHRVDSSPNDTDQPPADSGHADDLGKQSNSWKTHEPSTSPRRKTGAGTGEQGNRGKTDMSTADAADVSDLPTDLPAGFAEFWQKYPRKEKRQDAIRAWRAVVIKGRVYQKNIFDGLDAHVAHWRARYGNDTEYIPLPPGWIRGERWNDELPIPLAAVPDTPTLATVDDYLDNAAGRDAARILGIAYLPDDQPPSDPTPARDWEREAARRWITHHADALRERLKQLKDTG